MLIMVRPPEAPGRMGAIAQVTDDVTEWTTMFAPADGQAIHDAVLAELGRAAAAAAEVFSSQYGFTDQRLADAMAACGKANPSSIFLFDKTQEAGRYERPIVKAMVAQLQPSQWAIGTSSVAGQILHTKAIAVLYPDGTGWTFSGSFNLSASAQNQFNDVDLIRSRSRAQAFADQIESMFEWVRQHEPGVQP